MVFTFNLQRLDGDTAARAWAGKVQQYVLGLEEKTIQGKRISTIRWGRDPGEPYWLFAYGNSGE
jgi:hypothetical protein